MVTYTNDPLVYIFLANNNLVVNTQKENINISNQGNVTISEANIIEGSGPLKKRFVTEKITIKTHISNVLVVEDGFEI